LYIFVNFYIVKYRLTAVKLTALLLDSKRLKRFYILFFFHVFLLRRIAKYQKVFDKDKVFGRLKCDYAVSGCFSICVN